MVEESISACALEATVVADVLIELIEVKPALKLPARLAGLPGVSKSRFPETEGGGAEVRDARRGAARSMAGTQEGETLRVDDGACAAAGLSGLLAAWEPMVLDSFGARVWTGFPRRSEAPKFP
jgi:hypothetical protein